MKLGLVVAMYLVATFLLLLATGAVLQSRERNAIASAVVGIGWLAAAAFLLVLLTKAHIVD